MKLQTTNIANYHATKFMLLYQFALRKGCLSQFLNSEGLLKSKIPPVLFEGEQKQ